MAKRPRTERAARASASSRTASCPARTSGGETTISGSITTVQSLRGVRSDALVLFGVTGDLAYKKIFPALQAMARRGNLTFPVVGVARSGLTLEGLIERARASAAEYGGLDHTAFPILASQLR